MPPKPTELASELSILTRIQCRYRKAEIETLDIMNTRR